MLGDQNLWEPVVREITNRHGLPRDRLESGYPSSSAVFLLDSTVIKVFPPARATDAAVEAVILRHLATTPVPAPKPMAEGRFDDVLSWPYLILERVQGLALREILPAMPVPADGPLAGLRVRVSVDGGRVRTRVERPGRKTKKGRHRFDTPWREPRVLMIDVLDRKGKADRYRLPLYDVLLEDADATVAVIIGYLRLLGAAHAKLIQFIGDGIDWIWERSETIRQEAEIPAHRWVEVVDFYHASQHLHAAVELCRNRKASERTQWYEQLRHVLRTDPAGVHKVIEALRPETRGRRARKMKTAIAYFEKHAKRMAYVNLDRRKLPVGSGPVESAIRRVINLRFKAPSIFWEQDNVAELMHLRAAFKCGRWHEMLQRVPTQTFSVLCFNRLPRNQIHTLMPSKPQANEPLKEPDRSAA